MFKVSGWGTFDYKSSAMNQGVVSLSPLWRKRMASSLVCRSLSSARRWRPVQRSFVAHAANGEDAYREFLRMQEKLKHLREEQERNKSEKMYQAWMRAEEKGKNRNDHGVEDLKHQKNAMAGIQVVRTLAKEQRKAKSAEAQLDELQNLALVSLNEAAEQGHPSALVQLGNSLLESDPQKALDYYRMAGEKGSAEGWFNLGHCLWEGTGTSSLDPDCEQALNAFHKAVELGDADAMYFLGVHYLSQVEHDKELAANEDNKPLFERLKSGLRLIEKAAEKRHSGALHYLALFYLNGHGALDIPPCSEEAFVQRLNIAVEHDGSGDAHFLRGSCCFNGENGYARNVEAALLDFLKASDLGHAEAAVSAGAILHKGMPPKIAKDQQRAFALYQHAGELGSVDGWRNVVACYLTGEGVPQSIETAKYIAKTVLKDQSAL